MKFNFRFATFAVGTLLTALFASCDHQIVDPVVSSKQQSARQGAADSTDLADIDVTIKFNVDTTQSAKKTKKGKFDDEFTTFNLVDCSGSAYLYVGGMTMREALAATAQFMNSSGACTVVWTGAGDGALGISVSRFTDRSTGESKELWHVKWSYSGGTSTWTVGGGDTSNGNAIPPDLGYAGDAFNEGETKMELEVFKSMNPEQQSTYYLNKKLAEEKHRQLVQHCNGYSLDGTNNAFLHAYWTALNVRYLGAELAYKLVSAHEAHNGNALILADMDLFNDNVGMRIARYNPDAHPDRLASLVLNAILTGHGRMVVNGVGQRTTSDICY